MRNVALIGFMGTGKTSTGKLLATKLGYRLVDTDQLIEEKYKMTISNMFADKGEEYFRNCETETVRDISKKKNLVIATGGGIVKRRENIDILRAAGKIVCLTASVDEILKRTQRRGDRPVLDKADCGDRRKAIENLLNERQALYDEADIFIDTTNRSPLEVADEIVCILKREGAL